MKHFVVKDADGNEVRRGICADDMLDQQAQPGETVEEVADA